MDLKQLEYFVRVAELGSFTRAASSKCASVSSVPASFASAAAPIVPALPLIACSIDAALCDNELCIGHRIGSCRKTPFAVTRCQSALDWGCDGRWKNIVHADLTAGVQSSSTADEEHCKRRSDDLSSAARGVLIVIRWLVLLSLVEELRLFVFKLFSSENALIAKPRQPLQTIYIDHENPRLTQLFFPLRNLS